MHAPTPAPDGTPSPLTHPPTAVAAPYAGHGYPQHRPHYQHQHQPPYPYNQYGAPAPDRRNARSTALLIVVALVVALGAGGSVYALMQHGSGDRAGGPAPAGTTAGAPTDDPSPTTTAPTTSPTDGVIPTSYLGTWSTTIDGTDGTSTRRLTLTQGHVGDTVLTLVADGPTDDGGSYHCVFEAKLAEQPTGDGPLELGPSAVTSGEPASSCSPGDATEVTLLPDGRLKRAKQTGGESLTYRRQ